ncbi:MAG: VWA domain-containing protein [Bacteroidota bacterium]
MKHKQLRQGSLMLLLSLISIALHAQTRALESQVLSFDSIPLSYAQIQLLRPPYYLAVVQADSMGRFSFASQAYGQYQLSVYWEGFRRTYAYSHTDSTGADSLFSNFTMDQIDWYAVGGMPVYQGSGTGVQVQHGPTVIHAQSTRDVSTVAALSAGVYQSSSGTGINVRGNRSTGNVIFIDGVQVRGGLPQSSIAQLQVILGGYPAEFEYSPDGNNRLDLPKPKDPTQPILHPNARTSFPHPAPAYSPPVSSQSYASKKKEEPSASPVEEKHLIPLIENQAQLVSKSPLSTFSVDVDAASYSLFRRELRYNQLLAANNIRAEEFINYFDYDLPKPLGDHPISLDTEVSPCPWNEDHQLVRISLQAKEIEQQEVLPSNLVFLIDVSGSMGTPDGLPLIQEGLIKMVKQLSAEDRVSLVVYAGASGVVLSPTAGNEKTKITKAIQQLQSGGSTNGGAGIELAYKLANKSYLEGGNNRVILCTDGDFNVGISQPDELIKLIRSQSKEKNIFLSVLGAGFTYADQRMEELSNHGNGVYYFLDSATEAERVLGTELRGTLFTVAKDVKLQIEFNPQKVNAYRLLGYQNRLLADADFNRDSVDAGDIGAGHSVTAIYEIVPYTDPSEALASQYEGTEELLYAEEERRNSVELMTVKFRYKLPDEDQSRLISQSLLAGISPWESCSKNHRWASSVAECSMLLRQSTYLQNSTYEQAIGRALGAAGNDKERLAFIEMIKKVQSFQTALQTP